jgi:hypothetical protein
MTRATSPLVLTNKQQKWRRLLERLEMRCLQPIEELSKLGTVKQTKDGPLVHIDRGSKIIGVAHMDTVAKKMPTSVWWGKGSKSSLPAIQTIQLDDRLGVWVLLDLLPAMGMEFDVLLCDGEESGRSTASHFLSERTYNWGFEFDRAGMDTVLYDYDDEDTWRKALKKHGFDLQYGSFSDISNLTHLGCCFANFGVGYHNQHSANCYAYLDDTVLQALEFESWYKGQKDTEYKYVHQERDYGCVSWTWRGSSRSDWRSKSSTWPPERKIGDQYVSQPNTNWHDVNCPKCGRQNYVSYRQSHCTCFMCREVFPVGDDCKAIDCPECGKANFAKPNHTHCCCVKCSHLFPVNRQDDNDSKKYITCPYCREEFYYFDDKWHLFECPHCKKTVNVAHRTDDIMRCKMCDAKDWDEDGIAEGRFGCDAVAMDTGEIWSVRYDALLAACLKSPPLLAAAPWRALAPTRSVACSTRPC